MTQTITRRSRFFGSVATVTRRSYAVLILLVSVSLVTSAFSEDVVIFASGETPKVEAGKIYRLKIRPTPTSKIVFIDFHAAAGKDADYVPIEKVTQSVGGNLPWTEDARLDVKIADFDLDGNLEIQVLAGWGTGGSWYSYYRWDGKRYIHWNEPEDLGINNFDLAKKIAITFGRSGPATSTTVFHIKNGHFVKFQREIYDQAKSRRDLVPKGIPDDAYVLIEEEYDGARLKSRHVQKKSPEED